MTDDERLVWLLGDLMNAVENIFCQENPKRLGHINSSAISIIDEIIQPLRDRAEKAERERDEFRSALATTCGKLMVAERERDKLREALERIANSNGQRATEYRSIARAALETKP